MQPIGFSPVPNSNRLLPLVPNEYPWMFLASFETPISAIATVFAVRLECLET